VSFLSASFSSRRVPFLIRLLQEMAELFAWGSAFGSGIQSAFAWTTYTQQAYLANVAMRQNQAYQKKNYRISWIAMARDDIRSMMEVSVTRLNNYMIVSALILGLSCAAVMSVDFKTDAPSFLEEMFLVSMGMSIVFLILAILLGVKGQNAAFSNTMKLLIHEIRPENPAKYNHDYMSQAQQLERDGIRSLFRIPGCMPVYEGTAKADEGVHEETESCSLPGVEPCLEVSQTRLAIDGYCDKNVANEYVPKSDGFENLETTADAQQLWYLCKFSQFMQLWMPFDTYCKFAMSLGIVALGHGCTYFVLSKVDMHKLVTVFGLACVVTPFLYIPMVIVADSFQFPSRSYYIVGSALQLAGPIFGVTALYMRGCGCDAHGLAQAVFVPLCFLSHALFYIATFRIAYNRNADAKLPSLHREDDIVQGLGIQEDEDTPPAQQNEEARTEVGWENDASYNYTSQQSRRNANQVGFASDSISFAHQADQLSRYVRRAMRRALLVAVCIYSVLTFRGMLRLGREIYNWRHLPPPLQFATQSLEWPVAWHSAPFFKPHALACAGHRIFLADQFHVFELEDRQNLRRICNVQQPIKDITTSCRDDRCHPVLLVPDVSASDSDERIALELLDCEDGEKSTKLSPTIAAVDHANLYYNHDNEQVLVTAHGDELVRNRKSGDAWEPEWTIGDVVSESLRGLSADPDFTMLFSTANVQVRSATSRASIGKFLVPSSIGNLSAGCRIPGSLNALSLSYASNSPRVQVLTFPGFDHLVLDSSRRISAERASLARERVETQQRGRGTDHEVRVSSSSHPTNKALLRTVPEVRRVKVGRRWVELNSTDYD